MISFFIADGKAGIVVLEIPVILLMVRRRSDNCLHEGTWEAVAEAEADEAGVALGAMRVPHTGDMVANKWIRSISHVIMQRGSRHVHPFPDLE